MLPAHCSLWVWTVDCHAHCEGYSTLRLLALCSFPAIPSVSLFVEKMDTAAAAASGIVHCCVCLLSVALPQTTTAPSTAAPIIGTDDHPRVVLGAADWAQQHQLGGTRGFFLGVEQE